MKGFVNISMIFHKTFKLTIDLTVFCIPINFHNLNKSCFPNYKQTTSIQTRSTPI